MIQQGDVILSQSADGGDITVENGAVEMSGGLESSVYLSLFGGNEDDEALNDKKYQWWGNIDESDSAKTYRSRTQHLLQSIPSTSANRKKIEDAVNQDLQWMLDSGVASNLSIFISIISANAVKISIGITAVGDEILFKFSQNWKAN